MIRAVTSAAIQTGRAAQVEVQEAYGKQTAQRYPLDPPDPKMVVGEDASTHNRGMGGPLPKLPLSVQPGEVHVQVRTLSTPLHATPVHATPVHATPLHATPLHRLMSFSTC